MDPSPEAVLPRRSQAYPLSTPVDRKVSPPTYPLYTFTTPTSNANMGAELAQRQIQPPRPLNAWIIYRREKAAQLPEPKEGEPKRTQAEVSRAVSRMWRVETEAVKAEFEKKAEVIKAEHQARYPNYRFQPAKKSEKGKLRKRSRVDREDTRKSRRAAPYPPTAPAHQPSVVQYSRLPHSSQLAPSPPLSAASSPVSSPRLVPTLHLDQGPPVYDHPSGSYSVPATRQVSFRSSLPTPSPGWNQEQGSTPWLSSQGQAQLLTTSEPQLRTTTSLEMLPEHSQLDAEDPCFIEFLKAMLSAPGNSSVFQTSLDLSLLTQDPPPQLSHREVQDHIENHPAILSRDEQEMLQYINF